jgi:serine/threonine-protein kinase
MEMFELPGYEVIGRIGQGGMAAVYKARQVSLDRIVAVKVLTRSMLPDTQALERFKQEAKAAARINHPGIVQVHDYGEREGGAYIVMEYIEGHSLGELLENRGRMPAVEALAIAENVAEALAHAWDRARLIHCDIKPDNVMITSHGVVKVMDLGLSRIMGRHAAGEEDTIIGTPNYASPEQALGDPDIDFRTDIYSLGATLYHMLTGIMPFAGSPGSSAMDKHVTDFVPDPVDVNAEIAAPLAWLLEKMMAKDKALRVATWQAVLDDIELVRGGKYPAPPLPETGGSTVRRSPKRTVPARTPAGTAPGTDAIRVAPSARTPLLVRKPQAQPVEIVVGKESKDLERAVITFVALLCAAAAAYAIVVWQAGRQRMRTLWLKDAPVAERSKDHRPRHSAPPREEPRPAPARPADPAPAAPPAAPPSPQPSPPEVRAPPAPASPSAVPSAELPPWDRASYNRAALLFNGALESYQTYQQTRRNPQVLRKVEEDCRAAIALFEPLRVGAPRDVRIDEHVRNCYRLIEDARQSRKVGQ